MGFTGPIEHAPPAFVTGASQPCGLAVDAGHLYWANEFNGTGTNTIGRANLDGSNADQAFISGANGPCGGAVDGAHVYWANGSQVVSGCTSNCTSIGRANLDGTGVNQAFIAGLGQATGVAVDGGHIYWTDRGGTIGRAKLDGTGIEPSFIVGLVEPRSIAVDAGHIYWGSWTSGTIGPANIDGSGADTSFITIAPAGGEVITPCALAVDGAHIYWATGTNLVQIGRANLDGTQAQGFIGASGGCGVAVDALYPSSTTITSSSAGPTLFGQVLTFTTEVATADASGNPAIRTGRSSSRSTGSTTGRRWHSTPPAEPSTTRFSTSAPPCCPTATCTWVRRVRTSPMPPYCLNDAAGCA